VIRLSQRRAWQHLKKLGELLMTGGLITRAVFELDGIPKSRGVAGRAGLSHLCGGIDEPKLKIIDVFLLQAAPEARSGDGRRSQVSREGAACVT
jgi:hypothetical protein